MRMPETYLARLRRRIGRALLGADVQVFYPGDPQSPCPPDAQLSYSQEGEDRVLSRLLEGHPPGYYVDIGAHHPTRFSNTALLYETGWRGINVDPVPGSEREFNRQRPRDINLELGVGQHTGTVQYFVFDETALGTFSHERVVELEATTRYRVVRAIDVAIVTLADLLDRHLPVDQTIDLLTVDAEGLDLDILQSNDWTRFRPSILIAEDLGRLSLRQLDKSPLVRFLHGHGFEPIAKTVNSVFFAPITRA